MQRSNNPSAFDHASMEQLMERYRAELLSYQRATPPGKPTLEQMHRETVAKQTAPSPPPVVNPAPAPPAVEAAPMTPIVEAPPTPPVVDNTAPVMSDTKPVLPNPIPLKLAKVEAAPQEEECTPIKLAGIAAGIAADFTAEIFAAVLPEEKPVIVAEATAVEIEEETATLTTPDASVRIEEMRATLAESLADISEARVARLGCAAGCRTTPEELEEFAPSRRRTLLPDESVEAFPCGTCHADSSDAEPIACPAPPVPLPEEEALPPEMPPIPPPGCLTKPAPPGAIPGSPSPIAPPVRAPKPPPSADCLCCGHTEYEKCIGAYGTFRPYERWDHLTRAAFLQKPGEAVPVLARFAADVPSGGADACRCRRSFSVKFFCKGGEFDLLGQHLPVTVGCEQQAVLACCATTRPDPATGLRNRSRFWEYVAQNPVALHAAVWLYSDLGTIGSYRAIDGYCQPAIWVAARGKRQIARCCWLSRQRPQTLTRFEAEELCGYDPDAVARDFVTAINRGEPAQYELAVQLLDPDQTYPFDPYDSTLIWPQEIAPMRRLGLMTLERMPEQLSPDLDASSFAAEHLTDGIVTAPPALPAEHRELEQAGARLHGLSERERRRLIDNLTDELSTLHADLLEQVLILFSKADLGFGQALTAALGG